MIKLLKVGVTCDGNLWTMTPEQGSTLSFKSTDDKMKRLLRRLQAKDEVSSPNSNRKLTYQSMIDGIKTGRDTSIFIWNTFYPKSVNTIYKLMEAY